MSKGYETVRIIKWIITHYNLVVMSFIVGFLSSIFSFFSLIIIQGIFGKESEGRIWEFSKNIIDLLGNSISIILALSLWGISTIILQESNQIIVRIHSYKIIDEFSLYDQNNKRIITDKQIIKESEFIKCFLEYLELVIMTFSLAFFQIALFPTNLVVMTLSVVLVSIFFSTQRMKEGWHFAIRELKEIHIKQKVLFKKEGVGVRLHINRQNLFSRLPKGQVLVLMLFLVVPWFLDSLTYINLQNYISLLNFTVYLLFFNFLIRMIRQSALLGYRYSMYQNLNIYL